MYGKELDFYRVEFACIKAEIDKTANFKKMCLVDT